MPFTLSDLAWFIDIIAIFLLVFGFSFFFANFIHHIYLKKSTIDIFQEFRLFRWKLGQVLLLALEILIVSDVIFSIAHRTIEEITILGITVLIRVCLSYFLNIELEHIDTKKNTDAPNSMLK
jgi:uncharacterized membrane protein